MFALRRNKGNWISEKSLIPKLPNHAILYPKDLPLKVRQKLFRSISFSSPTSFPLTLHISPRPAQHLNVWHLPPSSVPWPTNDDDGNDDDVGDDDEDDDDGDARHLDIWHLPPRSALSVAHQRWNAT